MEVWFVRDEFVKEKKKCDVNQCVMLPFTVMIMMTLSSRARIWGEFDSSFPACASILFF